MENQKLALEKLNQMNISFEAQNLVYYSQEGNLALVELFINAGMPVNIKNNEGHLSLNQAARGGRLDVVKYLLSKGANINSLDNYPHSPLSLSILNGKIEVAKYLVENGADVNQPCGSENFSPLMLALEANIEFAKYLAGKGADLNAKTIDGRTAIYMAYDQKNSKAFSLLKSIGVKLTYEEKKRWNNIRGKEINIKILKFLAKASVVGLLCFGLYRCGNAMFSSSSSGNKKIFSLTNDQNSCAICGRTFAHSGYSQDSNGNWIRCEEPYQCFICSPSCGRKQMRNIEQKTGYNKCTWCKTGYYRNGVCNICGTVK